MFISFCIFPTICAPYIMPMAHHHFDLFLARNCYKLHHQAGPSRGPGSHYIPINAAPSAPSTPSITLSSQFLPREGFPGFPEGWCYQLGHLVARRPSGCRLRRHASDGGSLGACLIRQGLFPARNERLTGYARRGVRPGLTLGGENVRRCILGLTFVADILR